MKIDLPERLRTHVLARGGPALGNGAWKMMLEAANEIERLRYFAVISSAINASLLLAILKLLSG